MTKGERFSSGPLAIQGGVEGHRWPRSTWGSAKTRPLTHRKKFAVIRGKRTVGTSMESFLEGATFSMEHGKRIAVGKRMFLRVASSAIEFEMNIDDLAESQVCHGDQRSVVTANP